MFGNELTRGRRVIAFSSESQREGNSAPVKVQTRLQELLHALFAIEPPEKEYTAGRRPSHAGAALADGEKFGCRCPIRNHRCITRGEPELLHSEGPPSL